MNKLEEITIIKLRENEGKIYFLASANVNNDSAGKVYINYNFTLETVVLKSIEAYHAKDGQAIANKAVERAIATTAKFEISDILTICTNNAKITIEGL